MSGDFCCFYCGRILPASESSVEHIIPACLGATLDKTSTKLVCDDCNTRAGKEVDLPFCRDWLIESKRFFQGVVSRGKRPAVNFGRINWTRPEQAEVYLLEHKVVAYRFKTTTNESCVMFGGIGQAPTLEGLNVVKKSLKERFSDHRVMNDPSVAKTDEEREVTSAIEALGQNLSLKISIDTTAWDREVVKMGLGLACLYFGEEFAKSPQAERLRSFLWEEDPEKRDSISLHGSAGILIQREAKLSPLLHANRDIHVFCLVDIAAKIGFFASLFGEYENFLEIDATGAFCDRLPGTLMRGVGWIVDPKKKETTGPLPIEDLVKRRGEERRLAAEKEFALSGQAPKDVPEESL